MATTGSCFEVQSMGEFVLECPCDAGRAKGPFAVHEDPICERCTHPFSKHAQYDASVQQIQQTQPAQKSPVTGKDQFEFDSTTSRRETTVQNLVEMLRKHIVVQVRGTPTSGKTILSRLLYMRLAKEPGLNPIYIAWDGDDDPRNTHYQEKLRALSRGAIGEDIMARPEVVLIVDEAQLSYNQTDFWVQCVKSQSTATGGPYIVLFSSFGSAGSVALRIKGSAPVTLEPYQRVSLTHQPNQPYDVSLCFIMAEFEYVCQRWTEGRYTISDEVKVYLYDLTNGHPGLCNGLLAAMLDLKEARAERIGGRVTMETVHHFFEDDTALLDAVKSRVRRSLPQRGALENESLYPALSIALKQAVTENGIVVDDPSRVPGLGYAYKLGYLQAESVDDGVTIYDFPSELHKRYVASLLLHSEYDRVKHGTVRELCFEALQSFSPNQLRNHPRKPKPGSRALDAPAPEAQYQAELYRTLHVVTGGRCIIHSEFSYTTRGKVDFFLNEKTWGIEVMREGGRLQNHIDRFKPDGPYGSWKLVKDWVVLDFRQTEPPAPEKRDNPNLYVVVFDKDLESYKVLDGNHNVVIAPHKIFYA